MILGLDASTSVVGYTILDEKGNLITVDYINLSKHKTLVDKSKALKACLESLLVNYKIDNVYIEDYATKFQAGMSTANTITRLASWNGICQWIVYEVFGLYTVALNVNQARKGIGLKILPKKKSGGLSAKEQTIIQVTSVLGDIWPKKVLKGGLNKGDLVTVKEAEDMADSWVIAKAGFLGVKGEIK